MNGEAGQASHDSQKPAPCGESLQANGRLRGFALGSEFERLMLRRAVGIQGGD